MSKAIGRRTAALGLLVLVASCEDCGQEEGPPPPPPPEIYQIDMSIEFVDAATQAAVPGVEALWNIEVPVVAEDFQSQTISLPIVGSSIPVRFETGEGLKMYLEATAPGYDTVGMEIEVNRGNATSRQTVFLSSGTPPPDTTTRPPPPPSGRVIVSTTPPGAALTLTDQNGRARTGVTPFDRRLPPGRYEWSVSLDGFEPMSGTSAIDVVIGQRSTVTRDLVEVAPAGQISFRTTPAGASVTLEGENQSYTFTTPFTEAVPEGLYEWSISLSGYAPEAGDNALNVRAGATEMMTRTLLGASFQALKEQGDRAFGDRDYVNAIRAYRALGVDPPQEGSTLARDFADAQINLGQAYIAEREFSSAEDALRLALRAYRGEYRAPYYLGVTACLNEDYTEGRTQLGRVASEFPGSTPAPEKPGMGALADYQIGVCSYEEYRNGRPEMRISTISRLRAFSVRATQLIDGNIGSPALLALVRDALADATGKLDDLGS